MYLLHFDRIVTSGGGFQYQQVAAGDQWPGFFDFNWVTSERSASPLFDVQAAPGLKFFSGVQAVTIVDYSGADPTAPHYMRPYPALTAESVGCKDLTGRCVGLVAVVGLNCSSVPGCRLSGLTMIAVSAWEGAGQQSPAVRVWNGDVDSVTVLSPQLTGATDVLDANNTPVGAWTSRSGGGFTIVGTTNPNSTAANAALTASGGATHRGDDFGVAGSTAGHALLVGESGEVGARLAVETSGALRWGTGSTFSFDTTLERICANVTQLDLPSLGAGEVATAKVRVAAAEPVDVATATLSTLGESLVVVSARVSASGTVLAVFKNEGPRAVDLPPGTLRAVVTKVG